MRLMVVLHESHDISLMRKTVWVQEQKIVWQNVEPQPTQLLRFIAVFLLIAVCSAAFFTVFLAGDFMAAFCDLSTPFFTAVFGIMIMAGFLCIFIVGDFVATFSGRLTLLVTARSRSGRRCARTSVCASTSACIMARVPAPLLASWRVCQN
jgi:hypothetical protein